MNKKTLALIVMFLVAIIWGGGYSASQLAIDAGWSTFSILLARSIIGGVVCLAISFKTKFWKNKEMLRVGIISGSFFFAGYALQLSGQALTTIANTAFLTAAGIILVPIFSWIAFRKRPKSNVIIACVIGLIGAGVLSLSKDMKPHIGDLLVIAGAAAYAVHIIYIDRHTKDFSAFAIAAIQFFAMGVFSGIGVIVTKSPVFGEPVGWWGIAYFALLSGVFGFVGQIWGQRYLEPSKASLIMSQEGLFATIIAIFLMGQKLTIKTAIGGAIMIIAVIIMQLNYRRFTRKKQIIKLISKNNKELENKPNNDIIEDAKKEQVGEGAKDE